MRVDAFKETKWRILLGLVAAAITTLSVFLPYLYVGSPVNQHFYLIDLPGSYAHVVIFLACAVLAVVAAKPYSVDYLVVILGGIILAVDLTFSLGLATIGAIPDWNLENLVPLVGAVLSIIGTITIFVEGYILLKVSPDQSPADNA